MLDRIFTLLGNIQERCPSNLTTITVATDAFSSRTNKLAVIVDSCGGNILSMPGGWNNFNCLSGAGDFNDRSGTDFF